MWAWLASFIALRGGECFSHKYQLSFKMSYDFNFIRAAPCGSPTLYGFYSVPSWKISISWKRPWRHFPSSMVQHNAALYHEISASADAPVGQSADPAMFMTIDTQLSHSGWVHGHCHGFFCAQRLKVCRENADFLRIGTLRLFCGLSGLHCTSTIVLWQFTVCVGCLLKVIKFSYFFSRVEYLAW